MMIVPSPREACGETAKDRGSEVFHPVHDACDAPFSFLLDNVDTGATMSTAANEDQISCCHGCTPLGRLTARAYSSSATGSGPTGQVVYIDNKCIGRQRGRVMIWRSLL
jgi:hypothetical protein